MEINWLQLSDLHLVRVYKDENDKVGIPDSKRTSFAATILNQCADHMFQEKHIDFVIITGDFRNIWDKDSIEFNDAVEFITKLFDSDHLNMDMNKELFIIPGNHDSNRCNEYEHDVMLTNRSDLIKKLLPDGYDDIRSKARQLNNIKSEDEKNALTKELNEYREKSLNEPNEILNILQNICYRNEDEIIIQPFSVFEKDLVQKLIPEVYSDDYRASAVHLRTLYAENGTPYLNIIHLNTSIAADGNRYHYQFADISAFSKLIDERKINTEIPAIVLAHNDFYDLHPAVQTRLIQFMVQTNVWAWICGDTHKKGRNLIGRNDVYSEFLTIPNIVCSKSTSDETDFYSDFGLFYYSWQNNVVNVENFEWDSTAANHKLTVNQFLRFQMNEYCNIGLLNYFVKRLEKDRSMNPSFQLVYQNNGSVDCSDELKDEIRPELIPLAKLFVEESGNEDGAAINLRTLFKDSWSKSEQNHIFIEGKGGIGKTVSLLTLALEEDLFPYSVPAVYIPLRSVRICDDTDPIENYIRKEICEGNDELWKEFNKLANKEWINGPQLILLIDGFNEIFFEGRRKIQDSIEYWGKKKSVQFILTSRLDGAFSLSGFNVQRVRLQPLSKEIITEYLNTRNVAIPKSGNAIWNVINLPLMLVLYSNIKEQKNRYTSNWLSWSDGNSAGCLIWNYLQTEIQRFRNLKYSDEHIFSVICLLEYIAPSICWQMIKNEDYVKKINGFEIDEVQYDSYFDNAIKWFNILYKSGNNERLSNLCGIYRNRTRKKFAVFSKDEIEDLKGKLKEEINLFRPVIRSGKTCYTLMHQNFRDCLAAVYLIQQIGCLDDKELIDWQESYLSEDILRNVSELIKPQIESYIWSTNRLYDKTDVVSTDNLMRMEKFFRNSDFSRLDFSGMNLEEILLLNYAEHTQNLKLPFDGQLFNKTTIGIKSITSQWHRGIVKCLSISPDGKKCVSGSQDSTLRILDMESGQMLHVLEGHNNRVNCIAISLDGRKCVSGSNDNTVRIWDMESGIMLHVLEGHSDSVTCIAISPDGKKCASGSWDKTVCIWDMESGKILHKLSNHVGYVNCIAISPDGRKCVSGSWDNTVYIWDMESGQMLYELLGHKRYVNCIAISPDGRKCISGSDDNTVRIWDMKSGKMLHLLDEHSDSVTCIAISPDGRKFVSGSEDNTVRVWDMESGRMLHVLEEHCYDVNCIAISPDGRKCVSGSDDNTVRIWDMESGRMLHVLEEHCYNVNCIAISPDGRKCVSGSEDNTVRIWDMESGKMLHVLGAHCADVNCIAISPDERRCVSESDDNMVRIWDMESGKMLHMLEGHNSSVNCIAISADGRTCVSGSEDNTVRIWDVESGIMLHVLEGHCADVTCIAISPDGRKCVSGSDDNMVLIWDMESGKILHELRGHIGSVNSITISPDGRKCISWSWDCPHIWDIGSGKLLHKLKGHISYVTCIAISADGRTCVSGSDDNTVRIWDVESGKMLHVLEEHKWPVKYIAISPDGRKCVSVSADNTLCIWDIESGKILHVLEVDSDEVNYIAISSDGRTCVSGSSNNMVGIWDMESGEMLDMLDMPFGYSDDVNWIAISSDFKKFTNICHDCINIIDLEKNTKTELKPLYGLNVHGVDFSQAIMNDDVRLILRQNGAIC